MFSFAIHSSLHYDDADRQIPLPATKNCTTVQSANLIYLEVHGTVTMEWRSSLVKGHTSQKNKINHVDSCVYSTAQRAGLVASFAANCIYIPLSLLRDHASNAAACLQAVLGEIEANNPIVYELIRDLVTAGKSESDTYRIISKAISWLASNQMESG
jgi:hypothetical protein